MHSPVTKKNHSSCLICLVLLYFYLHRGKVESNPLIESKKDPSKLNKKAQHRTGPLLNVSLNLDTVPASTVKSSPVLDIVWLQFILRFSRHKAVKKKLCI